MSFRNLTGEGDWIFGNGLSAYATENNEIALDIKTRVLSFYRNCFFDLEAGIDYFNLLDYNRQQELENNIQHTILTTNGVTGVKRINLYLNSERKMAIEYEVTTIYSTTISDEITLLDTNV